MADPTKETKKEMTEAERQGTVPPPTSKTPTETHARHGLGEDQAPRHHAGERTTRTARARSRSSTPPTKVTDKADLAAMRMMEKEKADREKIMTTATMDAAAARAAMTSKEIRGRA